MSRRRISRAACGGVLVAFALTLPAGCATAAWPRAMVVSQITAPATTRGDWIESYDAVASRCFATWAADTSWMCDSPRPSRSTPRWLTS